MSPEQVPAELVEAAVPEVLALFKVCALDSTEQPNGACVYCRDDAEALARAALAAVLPDAQAAAFDDFAARVRARWAKDGERCPWVGALDDEAARLREGSPS